MVISFFGHRKTDNRNEIQNKFISVIKHKITNEPLIFLCGGYGEFDNLCAKTIKEMKKNFKNIKSIYVTPYIGTKCEKRLKDIKDSELYDEIIYPPLEKTPYRFAINKRNEYMIDNSDFIIFYVQYTWGGAYATMCYAKRKNKNFINLYTAEQ